MRATLFKFLAEDQLVAVVFLGLFRALNSPSSETVVPNWMKLPPGIVR